MDVEGHAQLWKFSDFACETTAPWIHVHAAAAHQSFQQDDVPFLRPAQNAKWSVVQKAEVLGMWGFLKIKVPPQIIHL